MFGRALIGRAFGIPVYASGLLLALLAVVGVLALFGDGPLVALAMLLLVSVFLHELGHALVARRLGVRVIDIVLGPLVCSARMEEIPERPKVEAAIAAAGPGVNFLLALLALPLLLVPSPGAEIAGWFVWVNLILGGFNLLPGFPMDGGRILRSSLAGRMGWLPATETAARVGRVVAITLAVAGIFFFREALIFAPLIAIYLWVAGTRELWIVRQRHGRSPFTGEVAGGAFNPFMGAFGPQPQAAGGGFGFGGGVPRGDEPEAREHRSDGPRAQARRPSEGATAGKGSAATSEPRHGTRARRPRIIDVEDLTEAQRRGFDPEVIEQLESFPGRLRRPRSEG